MIVFSSWEAGRVTGRPESPHLLELLRGDVLQDAGPLAPGPLALAPLVPGPLALATARAPAAPDTKPQGGEVAVTLWLRQFPGRRLSAYDNSDMASAVSW
jgi:hypothetical protein